MIHIRTGEERKKKPKKKASFALDFFYSAQWASNQTLQQNALAPKVPAII